MSQKIEVLANEMRLVLVEGLVPPLHMPTAHVFFWTQDGIICPPYLRWCFHPATGDLLVGIVHRHVNLLSHFPLPWPHVSWLRGFYFTTEQLVAIRPYFFPTEPYEEFDPVLNERVIARAVKLFSNQLQAGISFYTRADNNWLSTLGHGRSW